MDPKYYTIVQWILYCKYVIIAINRYKKIYRKGTAALYNCVFQKRRLLHPAPAATVEKNFGGALYVSMNEDTRELDPTNARTVKSYVSVKQIMSAICSLIQKKENLPATTARKNFSPRRT